MASLREKAVLQSDDGPPLALETVEKAVTVQWLTHAISQGYPGVAVTSRQIDKVLVGCSVKVFLSVEYNQSGQGLALPSSLVLKAGFQRHGEFMEFTYLAEALSYQHVLPQLAINAPRCLYVGSSPDGHSVSVLLEDLSSRNVRFCHASQPLTLPEARRFVTSLARFHGQSWHIERRAELLPQWRDEVKAIEKGYSDYFARLADTPHWSKQIQLPRCAAVSTIFHERTRMIEALTAMSLANQSIPHCVSMGDEHLGNLYIEPDGTPGFLDFQARIGPWSEGIAYFIVAALDPAVRRVSDRELIKLYLDTLAAEGVNAPDFDDAWLCYRRSTLLPVFVWMTNSDVFQSEAVNTAYAARASIAALDHQAFELLQVT